MIVFVVQALVRIVAVRAQVDGYLELIVAGANENAGRMCVTLFRPIFREQLAKRTLVFDGQDGNDRRRRVFGIAERIAKERANLLKLHIDLAGLTFAGIADDDEIRAAHLDPFASGSCRSAGNQEEGNESAGRDLASHLVLPDLLDQIPGLFRGA